jgi:hypothetical protein
MMHLHASQLRAWERAGLITPVEHYDFRHLSLIRKLRDLRDTRLSPARIHAGLTAMRAVSGMTNPLFEAGIVRDGRRLAFRYSGSTMEPIARQFVFDFDGPSRLTEVLPPPAGTTAQREAHVSDLFLGAVQLEETGKTSESVEIYEKVLTLDPHHAAAAINLGTICYNKREFQRAEDLYRRATESDPHYALAFFDLGNVLDELQRLPEAIDAYRTAVRLVPTYADAHYNLALAFERTAERRKALRHWTEYLKLDPIGPWANHARGQARKIIEREKLSIVHRTARISPARVPRPRLQWNTLTAL